MRVVHLSSHVLLEIGPFLFSLFRCHAYLLHVGYLDACQGNFSHRGFPITANTAYHWCCMYSLTLKEA